MRSLLESPARGTIRDTDEIPDSLYRRYQADMKARFNRVPTFEESFAAMISATRSFDDGIRRTIGGVLASTGYENTGAGQFRTPAHIGLPEFLGLDTAERTMVGYNIGAGGAGIKLGVNDRVIDKARTTQGPWSRCNVWEVDTRDYVCPVTYETSRVNGSRFGGFSSVWGLGETVMPPAADGKVGGIVLKNDRLLMYTTVSRDLWVDSASIARWFFYVARAEFRANLEQQMLVGTSPTFGPLGVVQAPSTVTVPKGSTAPGSISAANIDAMYGAIADGNTENLVWHAGRDTVDAIDQLAVSGQFPELRYTAAWSAGNPNPFPTLKGKPLFTSEFCPALGNPGDLIAVDWSDYVLSWIRPKPTVGALEFSFGVEADQGHRGFVGMPEGSVESRISDEILFASDTLAVAFKARMGGGFFWPSTMTTANGTKVGPAAIIAQR